MLGLTAMAADAACASHPTGLSRIVPVAPPCTRITDLGAGTATTDHLSAAATPLSDQDQLVGTGAYLGRSHR
jgi:hypothetical protein